MKKGQFALEFVVLVSFTILFASFLLVIVQSNYIESQRQKSEQQVIQLMRVIDTEVTLAQSSPSGYTRVFYLPSSIEGVPYSVRGSADGVDIVFDYSGATYVFFLSNGSLTDAKFLRTGYNTIYKDCSYQYSECYVRLINPN
ncbi:MAG: hypothetical protein ACP5N3_04625 [Candidatus Nanoarchaeia archaeon]